MLGAQHFVWRRRKRPKQDRLAAYPTIMVPKIERYCPRTAVVRMGPDRTLRVPRTISGFVMFATSPGVFDLVRKPGFSDLSHIARTASNHLDSVA